MIGGNFRLTSTGYLLRANRSARFLVRNGSVLTVQDGRLQAIERDAQLRLAAALEMLTADGKAAVLRLAGRCGDWIAALRRVEATRQDKDPGRSGFVLTHLSCPSALAPWGQMGILARLFGLTGAEEAVAEGIFGGHTVESYALTNNKGIATVKTQLNNAMHKLGVTRQAELVKLLASISMLSL